MSWGYVVDVGQDEDGKRKQHTKGGFRTRTEAQDALGDVLTWVKSHDYVEPSKQTLAAYLDEWLEATRTTIRPSTWSSYRMNVQIHIRPRLGALKVQGLTPAALNGFYADLLAEGRKNGTGSLSPRTVRYIHTILRKALSDGVKWGRLSRNMADLATPPAARTTHAPEMKTWTATELRAFLAHIQDERLRAAWVLAATTGMRRGEVLGLRWRDVDLDAGRVAIRQALIAVDQEIRFSEPKTPRSRRSVALDPATLAVLKEHRKRQLEERFKWGPGYQDQDLVFAREDGSPLHPKSFSKAFDRHVKSAALPRIRVHDLRHSYATLALSAGVHPKVVSDRLGHSTVSLTLDVYSHAIPAMEEAAADRVAGLIFG